MQRVRRLFVEFTVIVLGVLVALLMESAWQEHQDQQLAGEYLDRLRDEVALNRKVLESEVAFIEENCRVATELQAALAGDTPLSDDKLATYAWGAALNYVPSYETSTWDDLLASGRLGLIEDAELRSRIVDLFQTELQLWRPDRNDPYRLRILQIMPGERMALINTDCLTLTGYTDEWMSCAAERLRGVDELAKRIRSEPDLADQLNTRTYYSCNFDRWLNDMALRYDALEAALQKQ